MRRDAVVDTDRGRTRPEERIGPTRPWARSARDVVGALDVHPRDGLDEAEATLRRRRHGPNALRETKPPSPWEILAAQFRSLVIWLLLVAALFSLLFARWLEAVAIFVVVVLNAAIGFVTELRARRSMHALRQLGVATANVRRAGRVRAIAAEGLVPGDVVVLAAGDVITADLRLVEASRLQADESTLTGESVPVRKEVEPVPDDASLADRSSMVFKGTAVTRGSGLGVVVAIGMSTELGRIAVLAQTAEKVETPLERRLERLGRRLIWATLAIAFVTIIAGISQGRDLLLMVETGIALAVAAIPEGLPIVATLALARGMLRLARRHALINRLAAVETLGATDVILTDKTGTLTENRMTVTRFALPDRDVDVGPDGLSERDAADLRTAVEIGLLCNDASLDPAGNAVGDPIEVALLACGARLGVDRAALLESWRERRNEAFDPKVRAMATYHERDGRIRVAVKGAAETVLDACSRRADGGGAVELAPEERAHWRARAAEMASDGLRVLALAEKEAASVDEPPYADLTLVGLVGMLDPPRPEIRAELARCREAGLRVVMVTGDHGGTATSIARSLGLAEDASPVLGGDVPEKGSETTVEERRVLLDRTVFARADPEQKLRLIRLYQDAGAVVAMIGDGVNDAPALRRADIGVAMGGRGTQVAREAADLVLLDDSFASIVRAIRQGRVIFTNIRRFVLYLLSCNISEILVVFVASITGAPLPVLPLQILYLNLVTDVFPALALGFGEGDDAVMARPPRDPREPILARGHWVLVGGYGLLIAVCVAGALALALGWLDLGERAVSVSFLALAFAQVWHVFDMRDVGSRLRANDVVQNPWVWGAVGLCTLLLVVAVELPFFSRLLGAPSPGLAGWALALVASAVPFAVGQAWLTWRGRRRGPTDVPLRSSTETRVA